MKFIKSLYWRLKMLITRKTEWVDQDGNVEVVKEDWDTVWTIAGIHSHNWRWVHKWGKMDCGCTRNPLTRRMVLYGWRCPVHMTWVDDCLDEGEES